MTLKVTSSQILIDNGAGVAKFNSSDKLTYLKYQKTSTVTVSNVDIYESFYSIGTNEFMVLSFTINSCTGNVGSGLLGKEIPANGSVIVDFNLRRSGNEGWADTDFIAAALVGSSLIFKPQKWDYRNSLEYSTIVTNLTYRAKIYSYL